MPQYTGDIQKLKIEFDKIKCKRSEIIKQLKQIRDDVIEEDKRERVGKIVYSSTGIVGGGLAIAGIALSPFTFGASLGLTIAGAAVGAVSGGASISHGIAKYFIVKKKCKDAEKLLKLYKSDIEEFAVLIDNLIRASEQIRPVVEHYLAQCIGVCCDLANIVVTTVKVCTCVRSLAPVANCIRATTEAATEGTSVAVRVAGTGARVASSAAKGLRIAGGVFAALSIVIDIGTIVDSGIDLHKGKLTERAKQLTDIINELEKEA